MTLRRGTWVPLLPITARIAVVILVAVEPIIRGLDYVLPDAEPPATQLSVIENAMPITAWGVLCIAVGITSLAGFIGRWRRIAVAGLWLGGSVYAALAFGQWAAIIDLPWFDGIRGPSIVTLLALAQFGMAIGYALQPDDDDIAKAVAAEVGN